jgi:NADPH-dependent 2,4-dienoyl-CoA reductase/sulfur reductase-like enzyme/nitrite reductase/ring-hydroxylating ferredoxin subunit
MAGEAKLSGPDLKQGIAGAEISEGSMLVGHADGESVLLVRRDGSVFAIGATCTHYSGPLAEGILVGDTVRCPWHHACFNLRTGEAERAPALNAVACYDVRERDGKLFVLGKRAPAADKPGGNVPARVPVASGALPDRIVIVGAGAAGAAAAEMLRRQGFEATLIVLGSDAALPVDRPNLSKDYLAGTAPEEWIPLRPEEFYAEHRIELRRGSTAVAIDPKAKTVALETGETLTFDALLLTTGAEPVRLDVPVADAARVRYLRTLADSRAIIEHAQSAKQAVVIGASFIGLEVAASLRTRGLQVDVVAPESRPLERVLGPELGDFIRGLHEQHGVRFHLGDTVTRIESESVTLASGGTLRADLVVIGIGVRPNIGLAEQAGLAVDRGIVVDAMMQTSAPGIYAAGDVARYPDPRTGEKWRIEHWVVAQRQGQIAARNMLGQAVPFASAPFFWSQHYDVPIAYVGHAETWDRIDIAGSIADRDCAVAFRKKEKTLAIASIYRDELSLQAEAAMEAGDEAKLAALVPANP